ncbi:MFS transporter [Sporosarcina sp. ACRSM]|uniref:MFS transporter n=1 Tax=Sporosarcina sp. ACRSM TaxID=2918216 RepID=UPI001EF3D9A0|nr:MFS transporter [Sporosarcina sp. ACRSM]MCG7335225.1 MFS transporter [Sporosarcina sp. ACRSM]
MKIGSFRWFILIFVSLVFFINFVDRIIISFSTESIMKEFGFSATQWGIILSAFFWGLVPFGFLSGIAADKWGPKKVLGVGAAWWSIFTMATPLAFNYVTFIIARFLFGVGEGPTLSNGIRIVSNWARPKEYSTAVSTVFLGVKLGPALGAPIVAWLIVSYGWRVAFYVMGFAGLIWLIGWRKWFTDNPADSKYMSKEEKDMLSVEQGDIHNKSEEKPSIKNLFKLPKEVRGSILANFWTGACFGYTYYFLMTWLPGYFSMQLNLDLKSMGYTMMFIYLAAGICAIISGKVLDHFTNKTGNRRFWAYWQTACFSIIAVSLFFIGKATSSTSLILIILLFVVGLSAAVFSETCINMIIPSLAPKQAGSMAGILQLSYTIPGIIAPILTGVIVDATGSFSNAFYINAILLVTGAIVSILFIKPPKQQTADTSLTEDNPVFIHH